MYIFCGGLRLAQNAAPLLASSHADIEAGFACLNAAAGLVVADLATDLADGLVKAAESIDSGKAHSVKERAAAISRGETV